MRARNGSVTGRISGAVIVFGAAMAVVGCAPESAWRRAFRPSQSGVGLAGRAGAEAPVSVRRVPWERLEGARAELESELARSDAPREEWPPDQIAAADARLLRALQVTRDPAGVRILGVSEFRTTGFDRPDEKELRDLARGAGGDTVVWTSRHLGKADRVVQEPVTSTSTWTGWYGSRGRSGTTRTFSESTTTFVPVRVSADQYEFVAFVLRVD